MTYGKLTVVCGPMWSGKTSSLLRNFLWENYQAHPTILIKPAFDDRYSKTKIVNHNGLSAEAHSISAWDHVISDVDKADVVFLDEIQFFSAEYVEGDIVEAVRDLLKAGKTVYAYGLDMDTRGKPFVTTATLMAMADTVVKLTANCSVCGQSATKTARLISDEKVVVLGSNGVYDPRCNSHWHAT